MMDEITLKAYAKINLSLRVLGRRQDGYHDISSLMQGIDLHDVIKITKCPGNGTKYNFPHCIAGGVVVYLCTDAKTIPADRSNLAVRGIEAVALAMERSTIGAVIVSIDKKLPVAAGIAGGSGNAAAAMLGFNALLGSPFSLRELMALGAGVGADVPFSLMMNAAMNSGLLSGEPALAGIEEAETAAWTSGIGDIVVPTEPIRKHVIIANPGVAVSTREAYEAIDALKGYDGSARDSIAAQTGSRKNTGTGDHPARELYVNDFEEYTLTASPETARLKEIMLDQLDADNVLMSGSGPTIAAYYDDGAAAAGDYERLRELTRDDRKVRVWLSMTGIRPEEL